MWLYRTTWRKIGVIAAVLCILVIIGDLFYSSWVTDSPVLTQEAIDDCKLGRTTPEELGYPDLTCDELEVMEPWWYPIYYVTCFLSLIALGISIFAKEKISVELLNKHSDFVDKELVEKLGKLEQVNQELSEQEGILRRNQTQIFLIENERKNLAQTLERLQLQHSKESVDHASEIERVKILLEENKAAAEKAKKEFDEAENALNILKKHGFEQTTIIQNTNVSDSVIMGDFKINSSEK